MELTILGCYSPYPPVDGAGPGYLLEHSGAKVLIDCGSGVVKELGRHCNFRAGELTAVVLSHLHTDHFCDLLVLRYAHIKTMLEGKAPSLPVYCPDKPEVERAIIPFRDVLDIETIDENSSLTLGGMEFTFYRTDHSYPCYAMRVAAEGRSLVYTADTAWDEGLVEFAKGATLLMAEASLLSRDKGSNPAKHMTAGECGQLAERAGVNRLILTHLWPEYDTNDLLTEARAVFGGEIILAASGLKVGVLSATN